MLRNVYINNNIYVMIKLFEDYCLNFINRSNESYKSKEEVLDLVEDVFTEVIDKYHIKKIPSVRVASAFMAGVYNYNEIYYHIEESFGNIVFRIYQNYTYDNYSSFREIVSDCLIAVDRLKRFNIDYKMEFDSSLIQNPYNFESMNIFLLKLSKEK